MVFEPHSVLIILKNNMHHMKQQNSHR